MVVLAEETVKFHPVKAKKSRANHHPAEPVLTEKPQ